MGAALTVLVGIPIIVGKIFLAFDLIRSFAFASHLVLRGIRSVTDPVIDVLVEIGKDVILLPTLTSLKAAEAIVATKLSLQQQSSLPDFQLFPQLLRSGEGGAIQLGEYFVTIGNQSFNAYEAYRAFSGKIAMSDRIADRIWCMLTGYAVGAFIILVIAIAGRAGLGRISTAVAAQVKQHGTFLKLAFFMALELLVFPLGIGMVIDACTVPLFSDASLMGRLSKLRGAPFGVLFVSWLVGTMLVSLQ